ncbi:purine-nucleoside phosphorylase [Tautonia plasticadhaerens]|uniref:Purine nucleoside phosphorylase n=1 Tax=Tautonia plasticadhaerens TaxID=2527974 RepID=A0A518GXJ3_9BACT|nr:purine-nucleoside phosphorylase [Tautonia plasticadhaerens]QDV33305.1 Purine nucleoside phosphorylase 1 [Tautonia plasticadhaerens]
MQHHRWDDVRDAVSAVRARWSGTGRVGIVLGTGLGKLASEIAAEASISYEEIPHFPRPTGVQGHAGRLVCGTLAGLPVVAMEGRFHLYEGFTPAEITFPIRVIKELGCDTLIVSNAAGGLNPLHRKGNLVVIDDHLNLPGLSGLSPLIGPNDDRLGPRFPDMIEPYDRGLQDLALSIALDEGIPAHRGVYVGIVGPNLETRAEYRYLRGIGADVVGMSTTSEVVVAVHSGMKVLGFSIVTDLCLPDALEPVVIEEIIAVANEAEGKLRRLVTRVIERLPSP